MKTFQKIAALVLALVLATATAAIAGHCTAHTAADSNHRIHAIQKSLASEGYTLEGVNEQPIYYFVAPKAPYTWGTLVYTYSRPVEGDAGSVEKAELTVQVQSLTDGYAFPEITVRDGANN